MGDVRVSTYLTEDVGLDSHVNLRESSGEPVGWLYLGKGGDQAVWGSPVALRRVAAALVLLAERAEGLRVLRYALTGDGHPPGEVTGVRGS